MIPKTKRSGGPTSKKGKKAVAQNATKTGAYSRSIVLPNEDKGAYQRLLQRYVDEFKPEDMAETTMVVNLVNFTWRKMRLDQYEQNSLIAEWEKHVSFDDLKAEHLILFPRDMSWMEITILFGPYMKISFDEIQQKYVEYESVIERLYSQQVVLPYLQRFFSEEPELLEEVMDIAGRSFNRKNIQIADLLNSTAYVGGQNVELLGACTDKIIERRKDITWYLDNQKNINEAKLKVKESRLIKKMQQTDMSRVHDELDRGFYRTLSEIRKQQQWRREQNEIVVITEETKK